MRNPWNPILPEPLADNPNKIKIDEHRYVRLHKVHGNEQDILDAARICYDGDSVVKSDEQNQGLINHLLRNMHTSPFEQPAMVFYVSVDMPTATQMLRHRMAKVNGVSARYVVMKTRNYIPKQFRYQNKTGNMQAGSGELGKDINLGTQLFARNSAGFARDTYDQLINTGIEQGQARLVLPQSQVTQYVYQMDINNLMRFLFLRNDHHAQGEIREIASAMLYFFKREFPMCYSAWLDYIWRQSRFSGRATEVLRRIMQDYADALKYPHMELMLKEYFDGFKGDELQTILNQLTPEPIV